MSGGRGVLVFAPHPDDECIGLGGTILKHVEAGRDVSVVFMTKGESGPWEASLRLEEEEDCSTILGTKTYYPLNIPDGRVAEFSQDPQVLADITSALIVTSPQIIYIPFEFDAHPDHQATFKIVQTALKTAEAKSVSLSTDLEVWQYEIWTPIPQPRKYVDITPYASLKVRAIRAHISQVQLNQFDEAALALNRYRGIMSGTHAYFCEAFG